MPDLLELELAKAADVLVREQFRVQPGEHALITIDTWGSWRIAEAVAKSAYSSHAKVALVWHTPTPVMGSDADASLPDPLKAALPHCDVLFDFAGHPLVHSNAANAALEAGRARIIHFSRIDPECFVRLIGEVEWDLVAAYMKKVAELTRQARRVKFTSPSGTDVTFEQSGGPIACYCGECWKGAVENPEKPGMHAVGGFMTWEPLLDTINGTIVFDHVSSSGAEADFGQLGEKIVGQVVNGKITLITGGREAKTLESWLQRFDDANMYRIARVRYGFNPNSRPSKFVMENLTAWAQTGWGIGGGGRIKARSSVDAGSFDSSVWLDDVNILDKGRSVHWELSELARKLGRT